MVAWILLMIFGTILILMVPDDLKAPYAMPTTAPVPLSVASVDQQSLVCKSLYTIQEGDTLASIVQKTGVTEYAILYANPPARIALPEGNVLCIPDPSKIPTPVALPPIPREWTQSGWSSTSGSSTSGIRLPATGFGPPRSQPARASSAVTARAIQSRLYLPLLSR